MRKLSRPTDKLAVVSNLRGRLDKHSIPEPNSGCYIWTGASATGNYPQIRLGTETWAAHRIAYYLAHGDIPQNLCVCHRCDNTLCVNPEHLFLGTDSDNNLDKVQKGRQISLKGLRHYRTHLNEADIRTIFQLRASGFKQKQISERFGISKENVSTILQRRTWRHVDVEDL